MNADWLPDVHFGPVGDPVKGQPDDDFDPDDEELATTPVDVVMMLGFDPKDIAAE